MRNDPDTNPRFGFLTPATSTRRKRKRDEADPYEGVTAEVRRAKDGQFYVVVIAANREPVFTGETLRNKRDAVHVARKFAPYAELVELEG